MGRPIFSPGLFLISAPRSQEIPATPNPRQRSATLNFVRCPARKEKADSCTNALRSGLDATEAELSHVQSPLMLHLATHGFVLPEPDNSRPPLHGDTGLNKALAGEGVLGLRRGFIQAGTQNLLLTLWPIADEKTAGFMPEFYAAAHRTGRTAQALAEVQRAWLKKLRVENGIAAACRIAGPFILSFQGRPGARHRGPVNPGASVGVAANPARVVK